MKFECVLDFIFAALEITIFLCVLVITITFLLMIYILKSENFLIYEINKFYINRKLIRVLLTANHLCIEHN